LYCCSTALTKGGSICESCIRENISINSYGRQASPQWHPW
jgi:hypothetical protein